MPFQSGRARLIREVARTEGIFLDPVYTGKAFYGMVQELRRDRHCFGERIIFITPVVSSPSSPRPRNLLRPCEAPLPWWIRPPP